MTPSTAVLYAAVAALGAATYFIWRRKRVREACLKVSEVLPTVVAVDATSFARARAHVRAVGGVAAFCEHLREAGIVDAHGMVIPLPKNIFAYIGSTTLQSGMEGENEALGAAAERFFVACNLRERDSHFSSDAAEWLGRAAMGARHRLLSTRDLSWQWFNVLSFGLAGDAKSLRAAIEVLEAMRETARSFAHAMPDWSAEPERLGLFFHCYPHNSVNSLHLHMVDLSVTGPSFEHITHKNLPLDAVLQVLRAELAATAQPSTTEPWDGEEHLPPVFAGAGVALGVLTLLELSGTCER